MEREAVAEISACSNSHSARDLLHTWRQKKRAVLKNIAGLNKIYDAMQLFLKIELHTNY